MQLVDGTRWLAVFPLLGLILAVWFGQAVHAHRLALQSGYAPGGELRLMALVAAAAIVLTGYWLVGGRHGSPSATLGEYIEAWQSGRAAEASTLLVGDPAAEQVRADWLEHERQLRDAVARGSASYGSDSGLDAERPFESLRFTEEADPARTGAATIGVDLVRLQRVESSVLGVIPTARQQTVVIERQLVVHLAQVPQAGLSWLPAGLLDPVSWEIVAIERP